MAKARKKAGIAPAASPVTTQAGTLAEVVAGAQRFVFPPALVRVRFRHTRPGWAYFGGDEADLSPTKAAGLLASGQVDLVTPSA